MKNVKKLFLPGMLLMAGCTIQMPGERIVERSAAPVYQAQPVQQTQTIQKSEEQQRIDTIMQMKKDGLISDEQAIAMVSSVMSGKKVEVNSKSATVASTPAPQNVAPTPKKSSISVDSSLAKYRPQVLIREKVASIGSDTMDRLMMMWSEKIKDYHPNIRFSHEGKGSSTAIPGLMEGQSQLGPMSRSLKSAEIIKFKSKFGYEPVQIRTALDALAVFIHPENPLAKSGVSMRQLDAIFSSTCKQGAKHEIKTWGELGLKGEWANQPIKLIIRNSASGTHSFFRKKVLMKGKFRAGAVEKVGSAEVVHAVANDKFAIGFSGLGYKNDTVATLPVSKTNAEKAAAPNYRNAVDGKYPLTRFLYLTVNNGPKSKNGSINKEFASFILSKEGQQIVVKDGFFPLSSDIVNEDLSKLN